ncbi:MAG: hypothetical protein A2Y41_08775 [Spirochaetes bacterium GWB1_36_13]|nr:MAG: hypothetical protein A2Y41_08775 [Spirochaetes bacterium GWB1_36_13]
MFIKKILLHGFKSFADKTVIEFKEGINVIIGPNGCGKSNIIDAIRWVLGEQKVKMLRGGESKDVIFNGTELRSPAGYAEVRFYISNEPKVVNSDLPEIIISRKLFRSGESVYMLNKKECRLKDIQSLFMDTGVGKSFYSIIQQGQIGQILSSKTQERRQIFEEAAGVAGSKLKIKEAVLNLEKTEENLSRLYDLLSEVGKQKDALQVQAETALKYRKLKGFMKESDQQVFGIRYAKIKKELQKSEENGSFFQEKIQSMNEQIEENKNTIDEVISRIHRDEEKIEAVKEDERTYIIQESRTDDQIRSLRGEHERLKKFALGLEHKKKEYQRKKEEFSDFFKTCLLEEEDLDEKIDDLQVNFDQLVSQLIELEEGLSGLSGKIGFLKKENQELDSQMSFLLKKQKEIFNQIFHSIENKKEIISSVLKEKNNQKEKIGIGFNRIENFLKKWSFFWENNLPTKDIEEIRHDLKNLFTSVEGLKNHFHSYDKEVQEILDFFEKEGGVVFNEDYNTKLDNIRKKMELNSKNIIDLEKELEHKRKSRDTIIHIKSETHIELNRYKERKIGILSEKDKTQKEMKTIEKEIKNLEQEYEETQIEIENTQTEVFNLIEKLEEIKDKKEKMEREKNLIQKRIFEFSKKVKDLEMINRNLLDEKEKIGESMKDFVLKHQRNMIEKHNLETQFFDKYSVNLEELPLENTENLDEKKLLGDIRKAGEELEMIGAVNHLAVEDYEAAKERFDTLDHTKNDLEKAKEDIRRLIQEVNQQATESFMDTFNQIRANFELVFKNAFNGGKCELKLSEPEKPLESDIEIIVQPPGKKLQSIQLLSGGEQTMTAISIIFAIFMSKPSPFCLLDEVDAPLDEANVDRFIKIINQFSDKTQFVIITHNRLTAKGGDVFYGVTMQEPGVTKVFSYKPDNLEKENIA